MPKQSAKDELIARIDADIARLQEMRDYITTGALILNAISPETLTPKRARGKGKRGLPTTANVDGV